MKIVPFIYDDIDDLFANTYLLIDKSSSCVVIDPSKDNDNLINYIRKNNLVLKAILLTHGHFDHIRGVSRLVTAFNCPVYISFEEKETLTNTLFNCSYMGENEVIVDEEVTLVNDGDAIDILDEPISVIATPFHTKGSLCYYLKESKALFSGDFLFEGSVGRCDLPTSSRKDFANSISKILALPDETKVYPGHGSFTSIARERKSNPFLK